ncbi:MAG TPA: DUF3626 domain-containing protein [Micromonosporaceae bacterium]
MTGPGPRTAQQRAIDHVASRSTGAPIDRTLRVTLNFHPDWITRDGPILAVLAHDRVYRSQFETGTSNGGLTAHEGGDRWRWEHRIFAGAYDQAAPDERPKYGALNSRDRSVGAAPRFGSAHFRLAGAVLERTTFCFPDSVFDPADFGVATRMPLIDLAHRCDHDLLDDYIEAQVHGVIDLARDVEALVLDPCYRDSEVERLARSLPCPIEWHEGFRLSVTELRRHPDYRGPEYVALGESLAVDGWLDPAILGAAARAGTHAEQDLKRVWHYLARFGGPWATDLDR